MTPLDEVVHELGIENSDISPAEAIRQLHRDIEQLRGFLEIERRVSAELRSEIALRQVNTAKEDDDQ